MPGRDMAKGAATLSALSLGNIPGPRRRSASLPSQFKRPTSGLRPSNVSDSTPPPGPARRSRIAWFVWDGRHHPARKALSGYCSQSRRPLTLPVNVHNKRHLTVVLLCRLDLGRLIQLAQYMHHDAGQHLESLVTTAVAALNVLPDGERAALLTEMRTVVFRRASEIYGLPAGMRFTDAFLNAVARRLDREGEMHARP